jgi:MerR family transcriptional regulator, copper efflux regulator
LLPTPVRTASGYRLYDEKAEQRLGFIAKAKALGLTLREIREIVGLRDRGRCPCAAARRILQGHVRRVDRQIAQMKALKRDLAATLEGWDSAPARNGKASVCPRMEAHIRAAPPNRAAKRKGGDAG